MNQISRIRTNNIVVQNWGYDLNRHKTYNLNETAATVYQACDGRTSFEELKVGHRFTDDLIYLTLDQLKSEELLDAGAAYISPFAGVSRREVIRKVGLASLVALPFISSLVAPKAAAAQSGIAPAICTTGSGVACNVTADCGTAGYCNTALVDQCQCISNCCVECFGSNIICGGVWVDQTSDPLNCGGCGNVCAPGLICNPLILSCTPPPA